ncbi:hypothetical protein HNP84_002419 [Thermocatellispora tengchongensis]|uniref:Chitin-binding type-3 domain-containing protein n=1 Tax=Thermocatellispora tengchongensis TaxID=1073253 RepID=A0A840P474_9ACTN|nr:hypothetical protein [Thermocatellispora tengchongensis]MBB5132703.1 hypothetical protein [Thermocatellispora tengchongensis]
MTGLDKLPSGVRRAEQSDIAVASSLVAAAEYCGSYEIWSPTRWYGAGTLVGYKGRVWERLTSGSGGEPGVSFIWTDRGACPAPPPPSLDLSSLSPRGELLLTTLTPTLTAQATSVSGAVLNYEFDVCPAHIQQGPECVSSGQLSNGVNKWKVPTGALKWSAQYQWRVIVTV